MEDKKEQDAIAAEEMVAEVPVQDLTEIENPPTKELTPQSSLE